MDFETFIALSFHQLKAFFPTYQPLKVIGEVCEIKKNFSGKKRRRSLRSGVEKRKRRAIPMTSLQIFHSKSYREVCHLIQRKCIAAVDYSSSNLYFKAILVIFRWKKGCVQWFINLFSWCSILFICFFYTKNWKNNNGGEVNLTLVHLIAMKIKKILELWCHFEKFDVNNVLAVVFILKSSLSQKRHPSRLPRQKPSGKRPYSKKWFARLTRTSMSFSMTSLNDLSRHKECIMARW